MSSFTVQERFRIRSRDRWIRLAIPAYLPYEWKKGTVNELANEPIYLGYCKRKNNEDEQKYMGRRHETEKRKGDRKIVKIPCLQLKKEGEREKFVNK